MTKSNIGIQGMILAKFLGPSDYFVCFTSTQNGMSCTTINEIVLVCSGGVNPVNDRFTVAGELHDRPRESKVVS